LRACHGVQVGTVMSDGFHLFKEHLREMINLSTDFDRYTRIFYCRFKNVFLIENGLLTNDHVIKYALFL
jgi:hypothetical protein